MSKFDAAIIGSGPNGLAAAITLAKAGLSVAVYEGAATVGGGMRSGALTLPGFTHDICSAIHPLALASPFFQTLPLQKHGVEWVFSPAALAHPLDDSTTVILDRSLQATCSSLGADGAAYRALFEPLVAGWDALADDLFDALHMPRHPSELLRFSLSAVRSAKGLINSRFKGTRARALFAGMAAHSLMSLEKPLTAAFGMVLGALGHRCGWPLPKGGSQKISDALVAIFKELGGEIITSRPIENIDQLSPSKLLFCDITPSQLLKIAGHRLSNCYKRRLQRYRYGPGVCKVDWALSSPVPWRDPSCLRAATLHLGGTAEEIIASERDIWAGKHPHRPYVIVAQHSLFDSTRAPAGKHTLWGYCHVPNGSEIDMTEQIEAQIERFAPGFRSCIIGRSSKTALKIESYNPNYVGGDINGGVQDLGQLFFRPLISSNPYATPLSGVYLCSSATPPGGGVHGMCGYRAAVAALKRLGIALP